MMAIFDSTISYKNLQTIEISTGILVGGNGAEYLDGSKLRVLSWSIPTNLLYSEFWPSSGILDNQSLLIIGNNGYLLSKSSNRTPTISADTVIVPRGQRPALLQI